MAFDWEATGAPSTKTQNPVAAPDAVKQTRHSDNAGKRKCHRFEYMKRNKVWLLHETDNIAKTQRSEVQL